MNRRISTDLPQLIKFARMKAGLRQMDLAVLLGISENEMSKIETGRRAISAALYGELRRHLELAGPLESHYLNDQHAHGGHHG